MIVNSSSASTSDNLKKIQQISSNKSFFDLGISFQLGLSDGFSSRKMTQEERISTYPIFKDYSEKDAVSFVNLNVAYEGGYNAALKSMQPLPSQIKKENKK